MRLHDKTTPAVLKLTVIYKFNLSESNRNGHRISEIGMGNDQKGKTAWEKNIVPSVALGHWPGLESSVFSPWSKAWK
jgi:hypothetical protein